MTAQAEALGWAHHGRCRFSPREEGCASARRWEQLAMAGEYRDTRAEGRARGCSVVYSRRTKRRQQGMPDQGAATYSSSREVDLDRSPLPPATSGGGAGEPSRTRRKRKRGSPLRNGENTGAAVGCAECGASQSPMWRRGPAGPKTLCNACGIRYAKAKRRRTHLEELLPKLREEILTPAVLSGEEEVYAALTLMAISSEHFLNASQQR